MSAEFKALIVGLFVFVLKDIYVSQKDKNKELVKSMDALNTAVTRLTVQMEYLEKKIELIPEMEKDINGLGQKLRAMEQNN